MLASYTKVFKISLFPNPLIDLFHFWYDDTYLFKILFSTISTPRHDLKVKVTDLEFLLLKSYVKVFRTSLFLNPVMYFFHPQNGVLGGYTVFSISVIPSFRQHLRVLLYNFDSFCPILFKFTPHLDHQRMHV